MWMAATSPVRMLASMPYPRAVLVLAKPKRAPMFSRGQNPGAIMTIVTGILLIIVPVLFNAAFFALQRSFDYPAILRKPTEEVMMRFSAGGSRLRATWYGFAFTGLLFLPIPVLMQQLFPTPPWYLPVATVIGVIAGVVQVIGLLRWSFLVP